MKTRLQAANLAALMKSLSRRDREVLICMGRGLSVRQTALELKLSEYATRAQITRFVRDTGLDRHLLGILGFLVYLQGFPALFVWVTRAIAAPMLGDEDSIFSSALRMILETTQDAISHNGKTTVSQEIPATTSARRAGRRADPAGRTEEMPLRCM